MGNLLTGVIVVTGLIGLLLAFVGAVLMLGGLFAGAIRRLTCNEPTAEERDIARLLADTKPKRR